MVGLLQVKYDHQPEVGYRSWYTGPVPAIAIALLWINVLNISLYYTK